MNVPRAVYLRRPTAVDKFVGDIGQRSVLDHRRRVQHAAHRQARGGGHRHHSVGRCGISDVTAFHLDISTGGAEPLDDPGGVRAGRRTGVEHDASAARRRQLAGKEQAEAAQTTGDEIGAVGPGRADLFGGTTATPSPVRGTSSTTFPVCPAPPTKRMATAAS